MLDGYGEGLNASFPNLIC